MATNEAEFSHIIYKKGYPLHKLSKKERHTSMNLLQTFNIRSLNILDFMKDVKQNHWSKQYADCFLWALKDSDNFARKNSFSSCQNAALMEILFSCFSIFSLLPSLKKVQLLEYFREILILYMVQDPPESLRIFNSIEGFAIAKLFHELFAVHFEMMQYVLVPSFSISLSISE